MRRVYFLVPDVEAASQIVDDLLLARIPEDRIHVLAREGTPLGDLPRAGLAQRSDLIPALQRGVGAGGLTGVLAGVIVVAASGGGDATSSAAALVPTLALAGAVAGAWISAMIGVSVASTRLRPYLQAVEAGRLLMMVDVPAPQVEDIEALVAQRHPRAHCEGADSAIPAFP